MKLRQPMKPSRMRARWPWPAHWALSHKTFKPCTRSSTIPKMQPAPSSIQVDAAVETAKRVGSITLWHSVHTRTGLSLFEHKVMMRLHAEGVTCTITYVTRGGSITRTRRMKDGLLLKETR